VIKNKERVSKQTRPNLRYCPALASKCQNTEENQKVPQPEKSVFTLNSNRPSPEYFQGGYRQLQVAGPCEEDQLTLWLHKTHRIY